MSEEEDYDEERVVEKEEEGREDDEAVIGESMKDLSLHLYQYQPERKISRNSNESSIIDTMEIRQKEGSSKKE